MNSMTSRQKDLTKAQKACNRGAVVCFLEEEQVSCVTEDKLIGELIMPDTIVKVKWSDKECYKARIIFYGAYDEAKKEEDKIINALEAGKMMVEKSTGKLLTVRIPSDEKKDEESQFDIEKKGKPKKRTRKLLTNNKLPAFTDEKTDEEKQSEKGEPKTKKQKQEQKSSTTEKPAANAPKTTAKKPQASTPKSKDNDFNLEVVNGNESDENLSESDDSPKDVGRHRDQDKKSEKKSFSDDESLDNITEVIKKVLPKFSKKSNTTADVVKSTSQEKSNPPDKLISSEKDKTTAIKKGKKSNIEEDHKVLLRDVSVLKKDFQTLKERIDKLELELPMASSTPTKTPSTRSAQDDGSKEEQNDDHRGVTKFPHHILQHNPGYTQHGPAYAQHNPTYWKYHSAYTQHGPGYRPHNPVHRQYDPTYSQHDSIYRQHNPAGGDRQYTSYRQLAGETTNYRPHDLETDTTYNYYPPDDSWSSTHDDEHSESNSNSSYRDHGPDHRVHTDHYQMGNQPEKQLDTPATSFGTTSFPLLKNSNYLQSIKLQSSSIKNFAAKLNCEVFSREERMQSNVAGTCGKDKLDVTKIAAIKEATFSVYPTDVKLQVTVWKDCIKAIDEMNRRLIRKI